MENSKTKFVTVAQEVLVCRVTYGLLVQTPVTGSTLHPPCLIVVVREPSVTLLWLQCSLVPSTCDCVNN